MRKEPGILAPSLPRFLLSVREMIRDQGRDLKLRVVAGASGLDRAIEQKDVHRPGLALAGFFGPYPYDRVQILGDVEVLYLRQLDEDSRREKLEKLFAYKLPCVIVTGRKHVPQVMKDLAEEKGIPLIRTSLLSREITFLLSNYLNDRFAPSISIHGTLVDVYGTGLLFIGRAGIGKSEIALDLVERGHRLVADDVVTLVCKPPGVLIGSGPEMLKHLIEIRGVGVIDVREMFGVRAIRLQKRVETVVELTDWNDKEDYERLGLDEQFSEYLEMKIPLIRLPIYPGKNITVIVEVIALNHHLKVYGFNAARELSSRLHTKLRDKRRIEKYLKWDDE